MLSQLRTRGTIKHQAPVLNLCSRQLEKQRTDACSCYHPDGRPGDGIFCRDVQMVFHISTSMRSREMLFSSRTKPGCPSATALAAGAAW